MRCCRFCTPIRICLLGFSLFFVCVLTSLSCTSNVSASANFPSILSSDDNGLLKMQYQVCTRVLHNNRYIQNCSNSYSAEFNLYDSILNSDTGEYTLLWRYPVLSDTIGADKYIKIQRLTYSPGISVASGNSIFYRIENTEASVFLGSAREFFPNEDFGNRYQYHIGGLNSYLWYSRWNDMLSCPDMDSNICQFNYTWNTITGLGSTFRLSNTFTLPQGWQRLAGIDILHNLYDNQLQRFEWSPYYDNSVVYLLNTQNDLRYINDSYYIVFETNFDIISEFYDMNAIDSGVDVNDAISAETEYIENNLGDALTSLGDFDLDFSLINPIAPIIAAFTDITCYDFYYLPSMFGASTTRICTPWGSIRPFITPVAILMFNLILYRFIITWFKKGDQI